MPPIRRPVQKPPYKIIIALCCVLLFFSGALAAYSVAFTDNKIKKNVTICGTDVGKMTTDQAYDIIQTRLADAVGDSRIQITHNETSRVIDITDKVTVDVNRCVEKAYAVGRDGSFIARLFAIFKVKENILLEPTFDEDFFLSELTSFADEAEKNSRKITADIENGIVLVNMDATGVMVGVYETYQQIASNAENMVFDNVDAVILDTVTAEYLYNRINRKPKNARLEVEGGRQIVHEHKVGMKVDFEKISEKVQRGEKKFQLNVETSLPEVTSEKLKSMIFADLLGEYTTQYNSGVAGRSKNIAISASKVNGIIVGAGQSFSFNKVVGPRTYANGYADANVYLGGKVEQGVGGGICQVSSTIYSAQLYADLQTVSRSNHMFTVSYMPLGQDATVAWNSIDYVFKNNTPYPIKIQAAASGGALTVKIFGTKTEPGKQIKIENVVLSTTPPKDRIEYIAEMPAGERKVEQQGQRGAVVDTYKIYLQDGKEVRREFLHKSLYSPMERIIFEGKAEVSAQEEQFGDFETEEDEPADESEPIITPDIGEEKQQQDTPPVSKEPLPEEFLSEDGL